MGNNKCWQEHGETGTLEHCWWECKMIQWLWKTLWWFLKKLKIELPYDPAVPLLDIYPKRTKDKDLKRYLYAHVHSSITHSSWNVEAIQMSIDRWKDKQMWCTHTMECCSVIKRNGVLRYAVTWKNSENIMPRERSHTKKTCHTILENAN